MDQHHLQNKGMHHFNEHNFAEHSRNQNEEQTSIELEFVTFEDEGNAVVEKQIHLPFGETNSNTKYGELFLQYLKDNKGSESLSEQGTQFVVYRDHRKPAKRTHHPAMFGLWG